MQKTYVHFIRPKKMHLYIISSSLCFSLFITADDLYTTSLTPLLYTPALSQSDKLFSPSRASSEKLVYQASENPYTLALLKKKKRKSSGDEQCSSSKFSVGFPANVCSRAAGCTSCRRFTSWKRLLLPVNPPVVDYCQ